MRALALAALLLAPAVRAADLEACVVVGIADGDTLTARCGLPSSGYQQVKVRLAEIDAPERRQPWGERSRQHLADLCFQRPAEIVPTARDRYGRTVARVRCSGTDANLAQVTAGMAWAYTAYLTAPAFAVAEQDARTARRGLWVELGTVAPPVAPWDWRKRLRERAAP